MSEWVGKIYRAPPPSPARHDRRGTGARPAYPSQCRVHTHRGVCGIGTLSKRFKAEHNSAPQWPF